MHALQLPDEGQHVGGGDVVKGDSDFGLPGEPAVLPHSAEPRGPGPDDGGGFFDDLAGGGLGDTAIVGDDFGGGLLAALGLLSNPVLICVEDCGPAQNLMVVILASPFRGPSLCL